MAGKEMVGEVYEELSRGSVNGGLKSRGIPCANGTESEGCVASQDEAQVDRSDESVDWNDLNWGGLKFSPIPERVIARAFEANQKEKHNVSPLMTLTNQDMLKDSGTRQTFSTGAVRDAQQNKGRFDLIPPLPLLMVALVYELGARKYTDRNWEKGMPISRYIDSAERHLAKYKAGLRDEPHLSQVLWNIIGAAHTAALTEMGVYPPEFNDLANHVGMKAWEGCGCGKFTAAGWNAPALSPAERAIVKGWFGE